MAKLKSAPLDSLTCRLAKALAIVNTECGEYTLAKALAIVNTECGECCKWSLAFLSTFS